MLLQLQMVSFVMQRLRGCAVTVQRALLSFFCVVGIANTALLCIVSNDECNTDTPSCKHWMLGALLRVGGCRARTSLMTATLQRLRSSEVSC
jgi:hypothetical protein